jgi:hypothetical protein
MGASSIRPAPSTQTINVYDKLREDLLSGRRTRRKLQMRFLTEAYQVGQTRFAKPSTDSRLRDSSTHTNSGASMSPRSAAPGGGTDEDPLLG